MLYDGRVVAKIDVEIKQNVAYGAALGVNMDNEAIKAYSAIGLFISEREQRLWPEEIRALENALNILKRFV